MVLFERFVDTIFLKEDNSLERQIEELKSIKDKVKEKDKIERDIKLLEYGLRGENEIAFELKNANLGMYVLNDVVIEFDDLKAQVDYIIVTKAYTYLVECKNLIGDVTVDNKCEFRREYYYGGKKIKEAIYSPYTQAQRHKDILMKLWLKKSSFLKALLFEKDVSKNYKTLIVLANSKGMLNTRYAPKEIRNCTIRVDQLVSYIKKDIEKYDRSLLSSKKDMYDIANCFLNAKVNELDYSKRYTFIDDKECSNEDVSISNDNTALINALKEFRRNKSKEKRIPAYYIFTDAELNQLVSSDIKSLDDLQNSKILSDVKVKLHGEEIVEILCRRN